MTLERVELPGVGERVVFPTLSGREVGVLTHNTGTKELLVYSSDDPDQCSSVIRLEPSEAQAMADLLSLPGVVERDTLRMGSFAVAVANVAAGTRFEGRTVSDGPGASVVAIVRGDVLLPTLAAVLNSGDRVVVAGQVASVSELVEDIESYP